ncbi:carbohydrate ABC transporter permease [Spirochaeta isovalerica]|uniref:Multiple sugar transport system permease protein n=1 Tax=Spirochaeta isovalerica TaxID=150 RepID=A0A841R6P4_9SPIO|nr:carbohydrate ABC transporter permease [Spirochaeta isovalerica]MBB6480874.1 multiple sugar transport system permease protein [Spirochaeta isovalerica]
MNPFKGLTGKVFTYFFLFLFAFIFIFPFYYIFVMASWPDSNMFTIPPHIFFGDGLAQNWAHLFNEVPSFWRNFINSILISSLATVSVLFFCTMGGAAFALYRFKGKELFFKIILVTFMIPASLNIIPFFQIVIKLGWMNTWYPLIVPGMANVFGIFLMTQFIKTSVPVDLLNAARIDGMGEFRILLTIVFPLAKAGLSILGMLTFLGAWNDFLMPLILLRKTEITTLPIILASIRSRSGGGTGAMMVGNAIAVMPLTLVLIFFSKRMISNLTAGSIKG